MGGVDSLSGFEVVIGSDFDDTLVGGGSQNETLLGERGNDSLWGGAGNGSLNGGAGNDLLNGWAGNDLLNGGNGIDTVSYSFGRTGVYLNLGSLDNGSGPGRASDGLGGIDSLSGIEVAYGSLLFNDTLLGGDGSETFIGGGGDDLLFGGMSGNDYLVGGKGADKFRLWSGLGIDTVADFKQGEDKLLVLSPLADIISQSVINGSDTEIRQNGQIIGILKGVQIQQLTASDLITG
ncbi:calcium-binding protein [Microcoleus vaginatus]|uniref:calcium-binding protein n=1 Tax=Microcoleus vaginatus TaxID=119532 RepID=UPI001F61DC95